MSNFVSVIGSAFKWCCNARGKRYEETKIKYALYAQVVREGGLKMPTIMRFTAIPGHRE